MTKTILVTGASKGLGLECVKILLNYFKCNVVALSRSLPAELSFLKQQFGNQLEIVQGDVARPEDQEVQDQRCRMRGSLMHGFVL